MEWSRRNPYPITNGRREEQKLRIYGQRAPERGQGVGVGQYTKNTREKGKGRVLKGTTFLTCTKGEIEKGKITSTISPQSPPR